MRWVPTVMSITSFDSRVGKNPGFFKKTQWGGFFWVLLGFIGFFWVLLGFFGFYWFFGGFFVLNSYFPIFKCILCNRVYPVYV